MAISGETVQAITHLAVLRAGPDGTVYISEKEVRTAQPVYATKIPQ
ncbi:MAG: hypothetical protein R3D66_05070 [Alphaproteobacteria bacterium]